MNQKDLTNQNRFILFQDELQKIVSAARREKEVFYYDIAPENLKEACRIAVEKTGAVLVDLFAVDESRMAGTSEKADSERCSENILSVCYVFAVRSEGKLAVYKIPAQNLPLPSIASDLPAGGLYEREIQETFGIVFSGHPDPRRLVFHENWPQETYPLRKSFPADKKPSYANIRKDFCRVEGTGVFEIPVGPVHAGIIEPGHFRFSAAGEPIINLEAQLGYVHKGIEKLAENQDFNKVLFLSERISGDETVANSLAYCQAIEKVAGMDAFPERALYIRTILCELERIYNHLGDIAGICTDVAYVFATGQFNMMRRWQMILNEELTGSRMLRSSVRPGGVRKDHVRGREKSLLAGLDRLEKEFNETVDIIRSNNLLIDRVENTGVINPKIAVDLNAVGPAARSAGLDIDVRRDYPYAAYDRLAFNVQLHKNGDVSCRLNVKIQELQESIRIIRSAVEAMPAEGKPFETISRLEPWKSAFGLTEAPRGENIHWIMTGENNTLYRYKIRTPSFCNWPVLCHAVRGNVVPDFPLVNKSFNLSYSGNDL